MPAANVAPRNVELREIKDSEFTAAAELFYDALTALTERSGMLAPPRDVPAKADEYEFVARTGIFRVAASRDRLVSLACAIVRGDRWFLSGFWTDPSVRLQGIGGPLLREVWDEGRRRGTRVHYVWSSTDHAAIASYMKLGMVPGTQLFAFTGPPRSVVVDAGYDVESLTPDRVARLDDEILGMSRDGDHGYWLAREGARGAVVTRGRAVVGYYHSHHGTIGPVGWADEAVADAVLGLALRDAARQADAVQLALPGANHRALRFAFGAGLRLVRTSHLLWTEPIGPMERYVPSGPMFF